MYDVPDVNRSVLTTHCHQGSVVMAQHAEVDLV